MTNYKEYQQDCCGKKSSSGHYANCKMVRAGYKAQEQDRGWRVRPIKGGGFQVQRLAFWPLKVARQLSDGRRWIKVETGPFSQAADAWMWICEKMGLARAAQ